MKRKTQSIFYFIKILLFAAVISFPLILPYFKIGYFPTHDGEWAVVRLADMFRSLRDGQFPVRVSGALNFGYGYPLFNFAYPLPYYLGVLIHAGVSSFVTSIKLLFVGSIFFSAVGMFYASKTLWKNTWAGLVSAILYLYFPYRIVDLFVRGSLGESIAFAIFPFIFYFSLKLFTSSARIFACLLSLSVAFLIMTHNILTVLFLPILIIFILVKIMREKRWDVFRTFCFSFILGLLLSAFFWFPALFEKNLILLSQIPIADRNLYFVRFDQLLFPRWGYAPPTETGGFSYQLGIIQIAVTLIAFIVLVFSLIKKNAMTSYLGYVVVLNALYISCFVMMFSFTSPLWKIMPLLKEINYPWTLLSQLGLLTSLLAGFVVVQHKLLRYGMIVLCMIAIFLMKPYAEPSEYVDRGEAFYITNEATTTSSNELMPLWVKKMPATHFKNKVETNNKDVLVKNIFYNSKKITFDYLAKRDTDFTIHTIYYPGWRAYEDGAPVSIEYNNLQGIMTVHASPRGKSISLLFSETPERKIADFVSLGAIFVLGVYFLFPVRKVS